MFLNCLRTPNEIDSAFMTIVKNGVDALIADEDGGAGLAKNNRFPAISGRNLAESSGGAANASERGATCSELVGGSRSGLTAAVSGLNFLSCEMPLTGSPRRQWPAAFPGW
jgi:hypothetical protein